MGYAFVDLSTADEAQKAIGELSGKEVLDRKVSVQLARKPETAAEKAEAAASGGEGLSGGEGRRRNSGRGRGRGRGRGGRGGRGGRSVSHTLTEDVPRGSTNKDYVVASSDWGGPYYQRRRPNRTSSGDYEWGYTNHRTTCRGHY